MSAVSSAQAQGVGIGLPAGGEEGFRRAWERFLADLGLKDSRVLEQALSGDGRLWTVRLAPQAFASLCPQFDTLGLRARMASAADWTQADPLMAETLLALLAAPVRMDFEGLAELASHLRVRCHIARAAEKTALAFKTSDAAERPEAYWHYREGEGFLLNPGVALVDALIAATQPERTGRLYDFSCYRATEYVTLLGLAQEAQQWAPEFYERLQASARRSCIKSGRFHDVFLVEYGSLDSPVPARYYVPGDRVWFKNPDPQSSDASGYEGSWVIYMGGGLFSNFWKRDQPYTLEAKALEVYHWRDATYRDAEGELQIDERLVEARVPATQADAQQRQAVLSRMLRYRDPTGVYAEGGCIDATREFPHQLGRIVLD